jgi:hypothetical protein
LRRVPISMQQGDSMGVHCRLLLIKATPILLAPFLRRVPTSIQQGDPMGMYPRLLLLLEATQRSLAPFLRRVLTSMQQEVSMGALCRLLLLEATHSLSTCCWRGVAGLQSEKNERDTQ